MSPSPLMILRWKLMASTEAVTMLVLQCRAATMPATSSISFMVTPVPDTNTRLAFVRCRGDTYQRFCVVIWFDKVSSLCKKQGTREYEIWNIPLTQSMFCSNQQNRKKGLIFLLICLLNGLLLFVYVLSMMYVTLLEELETFHLPTATLQQCNKTFESWESSKPQNKPVRATWVEISLSAALWSKMMNLSWPQAMIVHLYIFWNWKVAVKHQNLSLFLSKWSSLLGFSL